MLHRPTKILDPSKPYVKSETIVSILGQNPSSERAKASYVLLKDMSFDVWTIIQEEDNFHIYFGSGSMPELLNAALESKYEKEILSKNILTVLLDITELSFDAWSLITKWTIKLNVLFRIVYTEPAVYLRHPNDYFRFDLSSSLSPIVAAKGFLNLTRSKPDEQVLVMCLGFEPARISHLLQLDEYPGEQIIPILGMPGYQIDDPFTSIRMNYAQLAAYPAVEQNLRYVDSKCPFAMFHELRRITSRRKIAYLEIGMMGTRPHALGSVLFSLLNSSCSTQLLYDYPKHSSSRTSGVGLVHCYFISEFMSTVP